MRVLVGADVVDAEDVLADLDEGQRLAAGFDLEGLAVGDVFQLRHLHELAHQASIFCLIASANWSCIPDHSTLSRTWLKKPKTIRRRASSSEMPRVCR